VTIEAQHTHGQIGTQDSRTTKTENVNNREPLPQKASWELCKEEPSTRKQNTTLTAQLQTVLDKSD
jgi:hypothetical protein